MYHRPVNRAAQTQNLAFSVHHYICYRLEMRFWTNTALPLGKGPLWDKGGRGRKRVVVKMGT